MFSLYTLGYALPALFYTTSLFWLGVDHKITCFVRYCTCIPFVYYLIKHYLSDRCTPQHAALITLPITWFFYLQNYPHLVQQPTPPLVVLTQDTIQLLQPPKAEPLPLEEEAEPAEEGSIPIPPPPDPMIESALAAFKESISENLLTSLSSGSVRLQVYFGPHIKIKILHNEGNLTTTIVRAVYSAAQTHALFWQNQTLEIFIVKSPLLPDDPLDKITRFEIEVHPVDTSLTC